MSENKIILYDIPSGGRCSGYSPNVWKIRLALNYKKIPYETKWVPLRKVGETMAALGLEPNTPSPTQQAYTVPTVLLPDGKTHIMNSLLIAPKLEELYPEPSLHLDTSPYAEAQDTVNEIIMTLVPYWLPKIFNKVSTDEDRKWAYEVRAPEAGYPLDQWQHLPADSFWEASKAGFGKLAALLERTEGPFVLGEKLSFGDFVIVGMIKMFERMGGEDLEMCLREPAVWKLWDACGEWLVRDD